MSEQVQEAIMKAYKEAQAHHARFVSPEKNLMDAFMHLTLQSDPFLAIQYGTLDMKDTRPVKYKKTLELLEENIDPDITDEVNDILKDNADDNNDPEPNPLNL